MKIVKHIKVKPLIAAIALTGVSVQTGNTQPLVSVGGSMNASATASMSSSFPSLNANKSVNFGYSGNVDVGVPGGADAVESAIADIGSDSHFNQRLPGLSELQAPSSEAPSNDGNASLVSETASEVAGGLQGGGERSGKILASAANSTVSEVAATSSDIPSHTAGSDETDSDSESAEETEGPDTANVEEVAPETGRLGSRFDASTATQTVATASGEVSGTDSQTPSAGALTSATSRATSDVSGRFSGADAGELPSLEAAGSAASDTAASASAHIQDAKPEDVADNSQDGNADADQSEATEDSSNDVAESENSPADSSDDAGDVRPPELAAGVDHQSQADAFANVYR